MPGVLDTIIAGYSFTDNYSACGRRYYTIKPVQILTWGCPLLLPLNLPHQLTDPHPHHLCQYPHRFHAWILSLPPLDDTDIVTGDAQPVCKGLLGQA